MAYTFNIENTWGTVSLNSNPTETPGVPGCTVIDYPAKSAPVQDGTETVDEQFRILVQGTTQAEVNAIVGTIQRAFRTAEQWQQDGSGPRTFFTRSLGTMTATYRSEIVAADFGVSSFEYVGTGIYAGGFGYKTELSGRLTRRNWWEGAETQIPLTNPNGTANTTGLRVYNNNDNTGALGSTKKVNWADIGTAIIGDLPGVTRFEFLTGLTPPVHVYIDLASSNEAIGTSMNHWNEQVYSSGPWTSVGDVDATGTAYFYKDEPTFARGTLQITDYVNYFDNSGGYRAYIAVGGTAAGTISVAPTIFNSYADVTAPTRYISIGTFINLYDAGEVAYPPITTGTLVYTSIPGFYFGETTGKRINIDFIDFVRSDQHRKVYYANSGLTTTYDDGIDYLISYTTSSDGAGGAARVLNSEGERITLRPGLYHRLYLHGSNVTSRIVNGWGWTIKLYYRPRYLSL